MTYVLALFEVDFVASWLCVCFHMPSNSEFAFLKKMYGIENLRFTSNSKLIAYIQN